LPGEHEVTVEQPSSVGPWSSTSQPSMSLPPNSTGAGLGEHHATAVAKNPKGGQEGFRMPNSSASDEPLPVDFGRKAGVRRALFVGAGLLAACGAAVALLMSRTPSSGLSAATVAPRGSGCPIDLPIPTVAAEDLPHAVAPSNSAAAIVSAAGPNPLPVSPSASSSGMAHPAVNAPSPASVAPPTVVARVSEPQPPAASYLATPVMSRREADHPAPARASSASAPSLVGIVTARRPASDDGPLSDQK
jgi:hypothetical protein